MHLPRRRTTSRPRAALLTLVAGLVLACAVTGAPVSSSAPRAEAAAPARAQAADNPLAGRTWGVYKGNADQAWRPYVKATGTRKQLLAKIALRPKAKWFGAWIPDAQIGNKVRDYIANSTGGDPEVMVQMTVFRMVPWEHAACKRLPNAAQQRSYRRWINRFAAAVGQTHAAIILQPDGPFALCAPRGSRLPSRLIGYAARKLAALPHTSVYIDAGASDWPKDNPAEAARILMPAGIRHVRGFALNSTHYVSTASDIAFGTRLVAELARRGVPGKHFVINTAQNGRPFLFGDAVGSHPDNADTCRTKTQTHCVTLGIPPTTDVANPRWGLSATERAQALAHVDGYLWFGRPWLHMQADPFVMRRALAIARTTPY